MFAIRPFIARYFVPLIFGVLVVAFVSFAAVFATSDTRTIHVFPSEATGENWSNETNALEQTLSGGAIFEDFTKDNSAFVESGVRPAVGGENDEVQQDATDEDGTTTAPTQDTPTETHQDTDLLETLPEPQPDVSMGAFMHGVLVGSSAYAQSAGTTLPGDRASDTPVMEVPSANDTSEPLEVASEALPVQERVEGDEMPRTPFMENDTVSDVGLDTETPPLSDPAATDESDAPGVPDDAPVLPTPTEEDEVTICTILDTKCSLLSVSGFGIGWDMADFEARSFTLNISMAAQATGDPGEEDKLYIRYFDGRRWHIANVITLRGEFSNFTNGGHFTFPMPEVTDWQKLDDLKVEIEYVRGGSKSAVVYVDSVWVDAQYEAGANTELPKLPHLYDELQALEDSAQPDILVLDDAARITFDHTDENDNETLIIKTDQKVYQGLTRAMVYFNVTNESSRADQFHLQAHFPTARGEVKSLKQFTENIPVTYDVPVYQPLAQSCEATWRYDEVQNEPGTAADFGSTAVDEVNAHIRTEDAIPTEPTEAAAPAGDPVAEEGEARATEDAAVVRGEEDPAAENAATSPSGEIPVVEEVTEEANPEAATVPAETSSLPKAMPDVSMGTYLLDIVRGKHVLAQTEAAGQAVAPAEVVEESVSEPVVDNTTGTDESERMEGVGAADAVTEAPIDTIESTTGDSDEPTGPVERAQQTPLDTVGSAEESAAPTTDLDTRTRDTLNKAVPAKPGYYHCPNEGVTLYCDELNSDKTNCIQNSAKVRSETQVRYRDDFLEVGVTDGEQVVDQTLFARAAQLFGIRPHRKETPPGFSIKDSTAELHRIEPGQTLYFEMEIEFPIKSRGEFFIEAIGKKGGYGLLDPWWNSGWLYRLPIYLDNTNNPNTLTDYQVYFEIDDTLTDFWANVQEDGRDIRFVRQVEGPESWYTDTTFPERTSITIASSSVSETLTNFPIYVDLADLGDDFWNGVQDGGADIRVTTDDGTTELAREVVSASTTLKTGELHFKATSLSSTTDNVFYIYYGSSTASDYAVTDTYGARAVWSNGYVLVEHMNDLTTSSVQNSAAASPNGAKRSANNPLETASGKLGEAQTFSNANSDYVSHEGSGLLSGQTTYTISQWSNATTLTGGAGDTGTYGYSLYGISPSGSPYDWLTAHTGEFKLRAYTTTSNPSSTSGANIQAGMWNYTSVTATQNSAATIRLNGAQVYSGSSGNSSIQNNFTIGALRPSRSPVNLAWDGEIDEVRVSNVIRSNGWRDTEFLNQATTTDFYATGTSETYIASETAELDFWMPTYDYASNTLDAWVQVDRIDANASTTIYLYYGNFASATSSDPFEPFTYDELTPIYYQTRDNGSGGTIEVASLIDGNIVQFNNGATSSLDRHQTVSYSSGITATSVVKALGPVVAKASGLAAGDMLAPISFASTSFAQPSTRNQNSNYHLYSPFGSSSVQIYDGASATPEQSFSIATTTAFTQANNTGTMGIVESTDPILFVHDNSSPRDGYVAYPAVTRDLYGVRANTLYIGITTNSTNYDVACSGGGTASVTGQNRGTLNTNTTCASSGEGAGGAARLYNITHPIGAIAQADGDGGESTSFLPALEFSTEYFLPTDAAYVAIVCAPEWGDVNIEIRDNTDTLVSGTDVTCSPSGILPGKQWLGNNDTTTYNAGYSIVSVDTPPKPFYVYYEDMEYGGSDAGGDENNLFGAVQFRKYDGATHPTQYTFGAQELSSDPTFTQDHFRFYENNDSATTTDPWGPEDLEEDVDISATEAVGTGDVVRLRLSATVGNAAALASEGYQFKLQYAEGQTCSASLSWSDVGSIGSGTIWRGYDNATPVDGSTLPSSVLTNTDVLGTYEEANNTADLPNDAGIGDAIEWDWVIENNTAPTNSSYCFRMIYTSGQTLFNYNQYPQLVTNSAPNEPSTITPFDNAKLADQTPNMTFVAVDSAGNDIDYQVQIDNNYDFSSPEVDVNSVSSPLTFSNVSLPTDKAPFNSGQVVQFTVPSNLSNGTTYYWRVRGNDPNGSAQWGTWSDPASSFTIDTSVAASAWFQTEWEQFDTNTLLVNVTASTSDDVRAGGAIGEYDTVDVDGSNWQTVTFDRAYVTPIIVASPRYTESGPPRTVRVRNKTSTGFDIKVDNHGSSTAVTGITTIDYMVVEEGTWTMDDGSGGTQLVAGSVTTDGQEGNGCTAGTPATVSFSPTFSGNPVVLHTVTSDTDTNWVSSIANAIGSNNNPTASGAEFNLMTSLASCNHVSSESIDYVAFDTVHGTTGEGIEFEVTLSTTLDRTIDALLATPYSTAFSTVPQHYIVAQMGINGGNGSTAHTDTENAVTTTNYYGAVDEDGPGADRSGSTEDGGVVSFATSSGIISALYDGFMVSTPIDFDDGEIGNVWGSFSWNDNETNGTLTYFVQYRDGSTWSLIPDTALTGNESGFTNGPVDLSGLDTATYNEIRLYADFNYVTGTPILYDWTVTWKEIVAQPVHYTPFDNEKVSTTSPSFTFSTTDPEGESLTYEIEWSTDRTFATASSASSTVGNTAFTNVTNGADTAPFNSGDTIRFIPPTPLVEGQTYWWRVRAIDTGSSGWSFWSEEESLTPDTSLTASAWFQTTQEQFDNDTLVGLAAKFTDDVQITDVIGEYGTTTVAAGVWTTVNLAQSFANPVVAASVRYSPAAERQRAARIRNKTSSSFEVLVSNFDTQGEGTTNLLNGASTTVDWLVVDAGEWTLDDGGSGLRIIADTYEGVSGIQSGGSYSGSVSQTVTFSPAFSTVPVAFATVSSENDSNWVWAGIDDTTDYLNAHTASTMGLYLQRGFGDSNHAAEDVDYIVIEPGHGTNNTVEFDTVFVPASGSAVDCCTSGGDAVSFGSAFSTTPRTLVIGMPGVNGGNGGWLSVENAGSEVSTSQVWLTADEDGPNQTARSHTQEDSSIFAFASSTGVLRRIGGALTGTITSQPIAFSDGSGPKWGTFSWNDTTPSTSTTTYQVLYATGSTYALIPDTDLPGNSTGTTTGTIALGSLPVGTYTSLKVRSTFECTPVGECPTLYDWTVSWSEGITVSGTAYEYDETTPLTTGTVHVAVNGAEQVGKTGTISGGTWSINNVNAFPDDIVTVWIDSADEANEAVAITKYDGTDDLTGMTLYERHVTLGSDENPTLTNSNLGQYDFSVSGNEDIIHDVDSNNDLTACVAGNGCSDVVLYVKSGTTYRPDSAGSGNVTTHDLRINGHVVADNNTLTLSGSWDNNSGFTAVGSTVIFSATSSSETIDSTGAATSSFNAVTFGQGSGTATWTPQTALDVNGAFTVSYGTYQATSATTTLAGNVSIGANGRFAKSNGTTTFDGSGVATWSDLSSPRQDFGSTSVNGTSKTLRLQSPILVTNIRINSGNTLDVSANNYALEVYGNFRNGGTFTAQSGTVYFLATTTGRVIDPGPSSFYSMEFNGVGGNWAFPVANVTALNNVTITNGTVTAPTGTWSVKGSFTASTGTYVHNNATLQLTATVAGKTVTPGTNPFYNLTFFGTGGGWSFGQANATSSNDFTILSGAVTLPPGILYVAGDFENEAGSFNANNGQVHLYTAGTQRLLQLSGSSLNDVRFTGAGGGTGDWFDGAWSKRVAITIPAAEVAADLTDFPIFVDLADFDDTFWSSILGDGGDVRVTAGDGQTELPIELDNFSTTTKTGEVYFKADSLASATDNTFYVYFANPLATGYASTSPMGAQAVWDDNYVLVLHMNDRTTSTIENSAGSTLHGTKISANNPAESTTAQAGLSQDFFEDHIQFGDLGIGTASSTVEAWVRPDALSGNADQNSYGLTVLAGSPGGAYAPWLTIGGSGANSDEVRYCAYQSSSSCTASAGAGITVGNWYYLAATAVYGGSTIVKVNDVEELNFTNAGNRPWQTSLTLGDLRPARDIWFDGQMDEIRISNIVRSNGWLTTTHNSMDRSSSFYATSSVETAASRVFVDTNATVAGEVDLASGSVVFPTGTLTLRGSLVNNGVFDANSGTVLFATSSTGHTVDVGGSDFYNVTFNDAAGGWTVSEHATSTNNWTITAANDFTVSSGKRVAVLGQFANSAPAATDWTGSTLALRSGTSYIVGSKTQAAETYGTLEIASSTQIRMWQSNAAGYSVTSGSSLYSQDHANVDGDLYIWGTYLRTSGTDHWSALTDFDGTGIAGAPRQVDVRFANGASATYSGASLNMLGTSTATTTIANQGSGTYSLVLGTSTLNAQYYSVTDTDVNGLQLLASTTVTSLADGAFTLSTEGGTMLTVASTTIDTNTELQIQRVNFSTSTGITSGYNVTLSGSPGSYWWFRNHAGNLDGENHDQNDGDPGNIRWDDSGYSIAVSGTVYAGEGSGGAGTVCDGATPVVTLVVDGGANTYTTSCNGTTGAYSFPAISFSGDVPLIAYLDTTGTTQAATVSRTPTGDITNFDVYENYVIVRHEDVDPLSIAHLAAYDEDDDPTIPFTASTTTGTFSVDPETALLVWAGTTFAPGGDVALQSGGSGAGYDGTLVLQSASTYTAAGTESIDIGGSWDAASDSTFTAANSTVTFNATTSGKTIDAYSPMNDVVFAGSGTWSVGAPLTVTNDLAVNNGTLTGTGSVTVEGGTVSGNGTIAMTGGTFAVETGGAFAGDNDWSFYNLTFGDGVGGATSKAGTSDITVRGLLTIASGHTLNAGDDTWTLLGGGTVFTVAGTFTSDTSTVMYASGTAMTVAAADYHNLVLAPETGGSPTYTFAGGAPSATELTIGDGVNAVMAQANTNDPLLTVSGDVDINTNATFEAASANDLRIGGSYTNNGTFAANGGGVVFNSADAGETVAPGGDAFHHVTFNNAGGGWTITESATSTGNFTLTAANDFTLQSGSTLTVQGMFTNSVGGAATTWTNTTLALNSGTGYSVNTKNNTGDTYATLSVGANTDVRMWKSTSTAYTVDGTGSLYSMDHNAVDGDLYIWGDYVRSSGADYWSYATDFDGTDLATTSSERQARVYLADQATTTLSGGSLSIMGAAGASTTIEAQGSGTYGLRVTGGTFAARYYRIRDIVAEGLYLSGTPTVTQMGNGDFLVEIDTGTGVTVAGSVLDQNPVKTWTGTVFNLGAVATGTNVTVTGSSISSWRFLPGTGDLYGENFDDDPGGNPGYAIFTDSAADVTISGNVYSDEIGTVSGLCNGSAQVVRLVVNGDASASSTSSCAPGTGLYSIPGVTFAPGDTITVFLDTNGGAQAANITRDLITSINDMHLYENRVVVRHEDTTAASIHDFAIWDSDNDSDVPFTASTSSSPADLTLAAEKKLIVWNNKTFTPDGDVTVLSGGSGEDYDGTLALRSNASYMSSTTASEAIAVGGSWLTDSGATFTAGLSSVTMSATTSGKTISPDLSAFHDLTFDGVGGGWTFADVHATTTGDLTIVNGTVAVASSSLAVGGSFVNSGSMSAASTSITFSSDDPETVTFNGDAVGSLSFTGAGLHTMTDTDATSTGSVLIAAGSVALPSGTFAVAESFENTGGSFTHSGTLRLYGDLAAQSIELAGSKLHNLSLEGSGSWAFVDSSATTTGSTTIYAGGLTAPLVLFSVGGSLIADGSFNANGGDLYFFATTTGQTVDVGSTVLSNVTFNGVGGGWTFATSATTTGSFRLQTGSAFTLASTSVLEVQGVFQNEIGGSATNWTDSTLYLNASGTSYTINSKTAAGDTYATTTIGANTDVRMWNSASASTSVATTSSLYSMDHADQPGDLYIWGEYIKTSGADYWSYATDFDGSALGGSSRQVDVRIASSSTLFYSGATLMAVGGSGATTTIAVQGSGAYGFTFAGTMLNMQYYSIRDTDANGLVLSGTPTITSLNNGDFELSHDDWVMLTIASSTLDQNPTKTISNTWFGTSTGVATGTNVKVDGTSQNYWVFNPSYGALFGEYSDDDGVDACGSIRWSDSTCLEVSQAHYRFRADDGGEGAPDNEWYDADWSHRKRITVVNQSGTDLTNYPIEVNLGYEAEMESDFKDLRFTASSGTELIPHWTADYTASADATVWVRIPFIPASDSVSAFVYYGNSFVTDASDGDSTFEFFDDFEDNDLDEYTGSDKTKFETSTTYPWDGSRGLDAVTVTDRTAAGGIVRDAAGTSTAQGQTIRFLQYLDASTEDETCMKFAAQSLTVNYAVCLDQYPDDRVTLSENVTDSDNSGTIFGSSTITYYTGWYEVFVDWKTDNTMDVRVYNATSGVQMVSFSGNDSTQTDGGVGFSFWGQSGGWDSVATYTYAPSIPTYTIGSAQVGGGASWKGPQDTYVSQDSNTNFRVRMSIENSGPTIEDQQFRLQYAPKTGYGSCAAVPSVSYNDVPNVAGCGVSAVCMVSSPQFDDGDATSQHLETNTGLVFTEGYLVENPSNQTPLMEVATSTLTEVEYALELTSFASDNAYCLRTTDGGLELDSYAAIPEVRVNGVPVVTSWTLNADQPIVLMEGETQAVLATGTVTDVNGWADLLYATSTFYRSGVGSACAGDPNNCYQLSSIQCPFSNCSGNTCEVECTGDIEYFTEATDGPSDYPTENWQAFLYVTDLTSNTATSVSSGVELYSMQALSLVAGDIGYGTLDLGTDTDLFNATSTLQNTGNTNIDVDVEGTDLTAGPSSIPVGNQIFATSSFTYSACSICTALSGAASPVEVDLPKATSTGQGVYDTLYWGIYVPTGVAGTTHNGQSTFYAIPD